MTERIAAAAVCVCGLIVSLPPPARHHNIVHALRAIGVDERDGEVDAFLTSEGRFVDRHEALRIARTANQITARGHARLVDGNPMLFSEDVW